LVELAQLTRLDDAVVADGRAFVDAVFGGASALTDEA